MSTHQQIVTLTVILTLASYFLGLFVGLDHVSRQHVIPLTTGIHCYGTFPTMPPAGPGGTQ